MSKSKDELSPTRGPALKTFLRFVVPSTLSLLAISTASIVDGFFVGNFVGAEALAAVNLIIPYITLLFGLALMLAVGGSVKASIAIGQDDYDQASTIFSQIFTVVFVFTLIAIPVSLLFKETLFSALGADKSVHPIMSDYFSVLVFALVVQLCGLVLYYFFRADNQPNLGMQALLLGAVTNIILDCIFVYGMRLGIKGAAYATLTAQLVQFFYLLRYFYSKQGNLKLERCRVSIKSVLSSAFNGLSEFINEISVGMVMLIFHWLINTQAGTQGIAAFSVVNYLIFVSLMIYYGIVDAMHVLLGQNFGAKNLDRVSVFLRLAMTCIGCLSIAQVLILLFFQRALADFFLQESAVDTKLLTALYVNSIWPVFLFNGFNVLICAYLTSAERAFHSATIALLRSLFLPILIALALYFLVGGHSYIYALPCAEALTFIIAAVFIFCHRPSRIINQAPQ